MDSSTSKADVIIKPVILKAGIPLAISLAAFIYAKIITRKNINLEASENQVSSIKADSCEDLGDEESFHSPNSTSPTYKEDEEIITTTHLMNSLGNSQYQEILSLKHQVEELQKREWEIEMQFVHYHDLKEQESILMELKNTLLLEKTYVEFLDRGISSMEAENKRLEYLVVEYLKVLKQLEYWKSQSGLLQRQVKKLMKKTKQQSRIIREKNLKIRTTEAEMLSNRNELEINSNVIEESEVEVKESQYVVINQLEEQISELLNKLDQSASSISKIEDDGIIRMEDYKQLVNEHGQLQTNRASEVKELIYLRWTNACLRHALMKNLAQQEENQEKKKIAELELEASGEVEEYDGIEHHQSDGLGLENGEIETCLNVANGGGGCGGSHGCSKRKKFVQKIKKWVEGGSEKEKHEMKCFGRHSVSDEAEDHEHLIHARKSCASA